MKHKIIIFYKFSVTVIMEGKEIEEIIRLVSYADQYLLVVNLLALGLMWLDKFLARHNMWRIPEVVLFISAIIGGSLGAWLGMYTYRHKTKHVKFVVGIPLIFILQCGIILYFFA